jgi:hypothetical protein
LLGAAGAALSSLEESISGISRIPTVLFPSQQDPGGAQLILSSIVTSIMTVVSIVFAILLMTLTAASTQFSPRILIRVVRDHTTQWTLGAFLRTFSYCMAAPPDARLENDVGGVFPSEESAALAQPEISLNALDDRHRSADWNRERMRNPAAAGAPDRKFCAGRRSDHPGIKAGTNVGGCRDSRPRPDLRTVKLLTRILRRRLLNLFVAFHDAAS